MFGKLTFLSVEFDLSLIASLKKQSNMASVSCWVTIVVVNNGAVTSEGVIHPAVVVFRDAIGAHRYLNLPKGVIKVVKS